MSDDDTSADDRPVTKKVVVKKTVVRKPTARPAGSPNAPRPVARPKTPRSEAAARAAAQAAAARAAQRPAAPAAKTPTRTPEQPAPDAAEPAADDGWRARFSRSDSVDVPKPPKIKRNRLAGLGTAVRRAGTPFHAVGRRIGELIQAVVDWFILLEWPRLGPVPASAVGGVVAGLVGALAGYGFMVLFAQTLGTPSGGGRYGSLALLGVGAIMLLVGRAILSRQAVGQPGLTSFLGIVLTLTLVLVFFLDLARSGWGWLLVPVLMAGTFAAAQALLSLAEGEPTETDETTLSQDVP